MKTIGIIPARLAATRLPDKPLLDIAGKSMIQRVWEQAQKAECLSEVYVATPDKRIAEAVCKFGGIPIMTSSDHRSGTDRLAEAARDLDVDLVVNIQGDEPLIDPDMIERAVAPLLFEPALEMSSLMCPCPESELDNPATVKVVCDLIGNALYFSRARIPCPRSETVVRVMQHIGLYVYRRGYLLKFASLSPTPLETTESLEQLRALENGHRIRMVEVPKAPLSIDTEEDLMRVRALF
jgi:3-deoxy-manno-octulosonate cytidylyltransferase (CMP-KDO synthetase)